LEINSTKLLSREEYIARNLQLYNVGLVVDIPYPTAPGKASLSSPIGGRGGGMIEPIGEGRGHDRAYSRCSITVV